MGKMVDTNRLCSALIGFVDSLARGDGFCHSESNARDLIDQRPTAATAQSRSGYAGAVRGGDVDGVRD